VTAQTWPSRLLWVDCIAGAVAGALVLLLSAWLGRLYALPQSLLIFTGAASVLYGSYSFSLARRHQRPMHLIAVLVSANAAWAVVCLVLATRYWHQASAFGIAHLVGEAMFVGGLAALEWRHRASLTTSRSRT
jgi:hypothetical protein